MAKPESFKDTTGRLKHLSPLPFLLELSVFAKGLLLGFHAHQVFAAQRKKTL
jgi:hypothetical protein